MWPVILRELRAESRRPFTYWLRVIGAVAIFGAVFFTLQQPNRWNANGPFGAAPAFQSHQILGRLLFGNVNAVLFALIWLIVPLLTADCINREKREGTLGLLFLTPLTAQGIVIGKTFAHALRALTFALTMLPVLAVPLLMGGVDPKDLLMAVLLDLSALSLALAAGLVASSWTKQWMAAVLLAEVLSFLFAVLLMHVHLACFESIFNSASRTALAGPGTFTAGALSGWSSYSPLLTYYGGFFDSLRSLFYFNTGSDVHITPIWVGRGVSPQFIFGGAWNGAWTAGNPAVVRDWFRAVALIFGGAWLFLYLAIVLAAWRVRRSWRLQTQTARAAHLERKFCEPRYLPGLFRKKMRRSLERNPIGWLQQYSVTARITKWGWCLAVVITECLFALDLNDVVVGQLFVLAVLLFAMSFSAAGSFRRERETGALELLLVTPLRVWQIVAGRVRGIWMQFLPATVLALGAASYVSTFYAPFLDDSRIATMAGGLCVLLSSFIAVPVIGLYWSMRRANFLVAWIGAALTALALPWCVAWSCSTLASRQDVFSSGTSLFICVQLAITVVCGARLIANLSARRFLITR